MEGADLDERFFKQMLDSLADGVYFCDTERRITYWNRGAEKLTGYTSAEMVGSRCHDNILIHIDGEGRNLCAGSCPLAMALTNGKPHAADVFLHHKEGHRVPVTMKVSPILDDAGRIAGAVEIFSDNSQKVAALEAAEALQKEALLDTLTGLPNRRYTELELKAKLDEMRRLGWDLGVLYIDIDHFKTINDSMGHDVGDIALKAVAKTLLSNTRSYDFIGRWGGDEFVAILAHVDAAQLYFIANRFRFLVEKSSLFIQGKPISATVSVGGTLARPDDDPSSLQKRADAMMYRSKKGGRNRVTVA